MQKKKRKQYTAAFKAKVVMEMLKEEKTVGQLAAEYEVHSNMLYRWRDQVVAGLPNAYSRNLFGKAIPSSICDDSVRRNFVSEIPL